MKKVLTLLFGLLQFTFISAQISIYGVNPSGINPTTSASQREYLFNYELNTNSYNNLYQVQMGELARASEGTPVIKHDGKYYGVTSFGGAYFSGQIFSYSDDDGEAILLLDYNPTSFSLQNQGDAVWDIAYDDVNNKIFVSS